MTETTDYHSRTVCNKIKAAAEMEPVKDPKHISKSMEGQTEN